MKIGEVSRLLETQVHVLRYWDEIGVVSPRRTSVGHRDYSDEDLYRLRVLHACRRVGMSLSEIRLVLHRREPDRAAVIEHRLAAIRTQRAELEASERFLVHVISCTHDLLTRCDQCIVFVADRPG
ncbi:MerR family transcriptional regulator [Rhodococcus sovatensis]|uniref:MerR family transcriptional regulator n=1 Tax=Rhodococcus sovatensis TaxID=1805840 RepID=A0ABZ2PFS9_9NOCA